jgi:STE24 endopeptidase
MTKSIIRLAFVLFALVLTGMVQAPSAAAQDLPPIAAPLTPVQVADLPPPRMPHFDPDKATNAYLAKVTPKDKARSDAYFEGGYILQAVDLIYTLIIAGIILWSRISAWMRDFAASLTRSHTLQTAIYVVQYIVLTGVAGLPLSFYEGFVREHAYGLSNQSFAAWAGEFGLSFAIGLIVAVVVLTLIYAAARKARGYWWTWGAGIAVTAMAVMMTLGPVFISPLFNRYQKLPDGAQKTAIISLAHANGVPADNVYMFDASRQSKRISANVSGFLGTTRISLNDNLLKDCSPNEVLSVMGHEIGHYVMNHNAVLLTWLGLLTLAGFWLVDVLFRGLTNLFGGNWDVRTIGDPAGLPLIIALFAFLSFLATPITNGIVRTAEIQADYYGLNAARQPDAEATVDLKLGAYRKLDPSPLEEFWFYDHPSGRTRISMAMHWKAAHIDDDDVRLGPASPQ